MTEVITWAIENVFRVGINYSWPPKRQIQIHERREARSENYF